LRAVGVLAGVVAVAVWAWQARPAALSAPWHGLLVPGLLLSCLSLLAYAARFRRVMHMLDLQFSLLDGLRIVSFAVFCQFFVPLGAGAELSKYFKLRSLAPERHALIGAAGIVLEHLLGLTALVTMASVLFAVLHPFAVEVDVTLLALGACMIVLLAAIVMLGLRRPAGLDARQVLTRLTTHKGDALLALGWSMLMHALLAGAVYLGSRGWDIAIGYWQVLFVLASAAVLQAVPVTLVGVGVADVAGTGLYVALGLRLSEALLLVSLLYCYRLLVAVAGGVWELDRARRAAR
jgi:hypothetical protein